MSKNEQKDYNTLKVARKVLANKDFGFQMASTADKLSWQKTAFNFLLQMHTESLRHQ